jgi:hypothetical protein
MKVLESLSARAASGVRFFRAPGGASRQARRDVRRFGAGAALRAFPRYENGVPRHAGFVESATE